MSARPRARQLSGANLSAIDSGTALRDGFELVTANGARLVCTYPYDAKLLD